MAALGVVGATGFVGRALIDDCQSRAIEIVATHRKPLAHHLSTSAQCRWQRFDLHDVLDRDDSAIPANLLADCDWVVCLAGTAHVQAADTVYRREAAAYQRLIGGLLDNGKRVIYISSVKASDGQDAYAQSKREIERYLLARPEDAWVVLRPALIYGQDMKGFLAQWAHALASGWMPRLPDVSNQRSLVSINNLLSAIHFVMQSPACLGQVLAVTDENSYSTAQLQASLMQAVGREWRLPAVPQRCWQLVAGLGDYLPLPFNSAHYTRLFGDANYQDPTLMALGWQPQENFEMFCRRYVL